MYLRMMGLSYNTQVELVKELREKDEDFVDSALEVSPVQPTILFAIRKPVYFFRRKARLMNYR